MRVLVVPNLQKNRAEKSTREIVDILIKSGAKVVMESQFEDVFGGLDVKFSALNELLPICDLLIAIGGDGTIIHSAKYAALHGLPILGINLGRVGFLAQLELSEIDKLPDIISGKYYIDERMLLKAVLTKASKKQYNFTAMNDVVFSKGSLSRMVDLRVSYDGALISEYRADGLIFATPTGSTAYSMSAGGPVVDPSLESIVMTPISPYTFGSRPLIFSPNKQLEVMQKLINYEDKLYMTVDGEKVVELEATDKVQIMKDSQKVKLVGLGNNGFYEALNSKLKRL